MPPESTIPPDMIQRGDVTDTNLDELCEREFVHIFELNTH